MANYIYYLDVPAGTPESDPVEMVIDAVPGTLTRLDVMFPPGPQGEVGIRLLHSRHQIVPSFLGQFLNWDSGIVAVLVDYELPQSDAQLVLQGVSPNASFGHTIGVRLEIEPPQAPGQASLILPALERVNVLIGERYDIGEE
jgi:hypothetical protein